MAKDIYVGSLISERTLEHSSGPWKKHKYIKKIGDRYVYAKNKVEWAINEAKNFVRTLDVEPVARDFHERQANRYLEGAKKENEAAKSLETNPYFDRDGKVAEQHRDYAKYDTQDFEKSRQRAREEHSRFAKTGAGKLESAKKTIEKKFTRHKRLSESAGEHYRKEKEARRDAENLKISSEIDKDIARSGRSPFVSSGSGVLSKKDRDRYATTSRNASRQAKQKEREATTHARLRAARESEFERNSIKQRSERAKKRVMKALGRFKKRK